ncbi:hypothetical protein QRB36_25920, partial [Mycobacterium marseillense]|uniref:hypothetical protein n=1 Tax=Mycobacterium marseillense TaxID=701042 RepID=UPI002598738C
SLCQGTGAIPAPEADPPPNYCTARTAMMPQRRRTRTQDRATRVATERKHNRDARLARRAPSATCSWPAVYGPDDDPPPF